MAKEKTAPVKKENTFGYYLYEAGKSFWQSANLMYGKQAGFLISEGQHRLPVDERSALYDRLNKERIAKEEAAKAKEKKNKKE